MTRQPSASQPPEPVMTPTMPPPRLPALDPATLTPEQKAVFDAIAAGPRGRVQGPLAVWLHSPGLADNAQRLGAFCRYGTSLEPRLSELAILVTGRAWGAQFEWAVHKPIPLQAGTSGAGGDSTDNRSTTTFERGEERGAPSFT